MWVRLTEGFPFVLLPYELFAATSWQTAKTVVCTLRTVGMAVILWHSNFFEQEI